MPLIPIDWLASHVEVPEDLTASQLAADLVKVGLEEEEIHAPDVTGPIVVGKVLTLVKEEQKNGKLINYCRVDVGSHNDAPGEGKKTCGFPVAWDYLWCAQFCGRRLRGCVASWRGASGRFCDCCA